MALPYLTHKGWFGICPVYFGGLETDAPLVVERHWVLLPLFILSEWLFDLFAMLERLYDPDFEPEGWPLLITAEIEPRPAPVVEERE